MAAVWKLHKELASSVSRWHTEYIYTHTYCTPAHSLHRHLHKGCMYIDRHRHTHNHKIHTCTTPWVLGAKRGQSGHCVLETFGQCPLKTYYHSYSFILTQEEPNILYRYPQLSFSRSVSLPSTFFSVAYITQEASSSHQIKTYREIWIFSTQTMASFSLYRQPLLICTPGCVLVYL